MVGEMNCPHTHVPYLIINEICPDYFLPKPKPNSSEPSQLGRVCGGGPKEEQELRSRRRRDPVIAVIAGLKQT